MSECIFTSMGEWCAVHGSSYAADDRCSKWIVAAEERIRTLEAENGRLTGIIQETYTLAEEDHWRLFEVLAENERLREELEDGNAAYRSVMEEACAGGITYETDDRLHCTCVPHLREGVRALQAHVRELEALLLEGLAITYADWDCRHPDEWRADVERVMRRD